MTATPRLVVDRRTGSPSPIAGPPGRASTRLADLAHRAGRPARPRSVRCEASRLAGAGSRMPASTTPTSIFVPPRSTPIVSLRSRETVPRVWRRGPEASACITALHGTRRRAAALRTGPSTRSTAPPGGPRARGFAGPRKGSDRLGGPARLRGATPRLRAPLEAAVAKRAEPGRSPRERAGRGPAAAASPARSRPGARSGARPDRRRRLDPAQLPRLRGLRPDPVLQALRRSRGQLCTATRSCCRARRRSSCSAPTRGRPAPDEPGTPIDEKCFEQQSKATRRTSAANGEYRADTLMLIRAGGGTFDKLSIPRDTSPKIPGQADAENQRRLRLRRRGAADQDGRAVPRDPDRPRRDRRLHRLRRPDRRGRRDQGRPSPTSSAPTSPAAPAAARAGSRCTCRKGENTLDGEKALAYSRVREPSELPAAGQERLRSATTTRARPGPAAGHQRDQEHASPTRCDSPTTSSRPVIGWDAPKAFVSDMGFLTMPQLVLAAAIGGSTEAEVLCKPSSDGSGGPKAASNPGGTAPKAVHGFLNGEAAPKPPECSPGG